MAAGVVPQSSCSLSPQAPASTCSISAVGAAGVALAQKAEIDRPGLRRLQHARQIPCAGRAGGGVGARGRPRAAAEHRRDAVGEGLLRPAAGAMKCTWLSMPPAVTIRCSPAITSVLAPTTRSGSTPAIVSGLPALPTLTIRPSLMPISPLTMPQWSTISALVMTRSSAPPVPFT